MLKEGAGTDLLLDYLNLLLRRKSAFLLLIFAHGNAQSR